MLKNQLGLEGENLTDEQLQQLADSYYGEFEEDDVNLDDHHIGIHD